MSNIMIFRQAIIDKIKVEFPKLDVKSHDGRFSPESLIHASLQDPKVLM